MAGLYSGRRLYASDLDPDRVNTFNSRGFSGTAITADAEKVYPYKQDTISIADIDAYNDPYYTFKLFWENSQKTSRIVLFFTDGLRQGIIRTGTFRGEKIEDINARRKLYNFYFRHALKIVLDIVGDQWIVLKKSFYLRHHQLYWGLVIERRP